MKKALRMPGRRRGDGTTTTSSGGGGGNAPPPPPPPPTSSTGGGHDHHVAMVTPGSGSGPGGGGGLVDKTSSSDILMMTTTAGATSTYATANATATATAAAEVHSDAENRLAQQQHTHGQLMSKNTSSNTSMGNTNNTAAALPEAPPSSPSAAAGGVANPGPMSNGTNTSLNSNSSTTLNTNSNHNSGPTLVFPSSSSARATARDILRSISSSSKKKAKIVPPPPPPRYHQGQGQQQQGQGQVQQQQAQGQQRQAQAQQQAQAQGQQGQARAHQQGQRQAQRGSILTPRSRDRQLKDLDSLVDLTSSSSVPPGTGAGGGSAPVPPPPPITGGGGGSSTSSERLRQEARSRAAELRAATATASSTATGSSSATATATTSVTEQTRSTTSASSSSPTSSPSSPTSSAKIKAPLSPGKAALDELLLMEKKAGKGKGSKGGKGKDRSGREKDGGATTTSMGSDSNTSGKIAAARRIIAQRTRSGGTVGGGGGAGGGVSVGGAGGDDLLPPPPPPPRPIREESQQKQTGRGGYGHGHGERVEYHLYPNAGYDDDDDDDGRLPGTTSAVSAASATAPSAALPHRPSLPSVSDSILDSDSDSATEVFEDEQPDGPIRSDDDDDADDDDDDDDDDDGNDSANIDEDDYDPLEQLALGGGEGWTNARVSDIFGTGIRRRSGDGDWKGGSRSSAVGGGGGGGGRGGDNDDRGTAGDRGGIDLGQDQLGDDEDECDSHGDVDDDGGRGLHHGGGGGSDDEHDAGGDDEDDDSHGGKDDGTKSGSDSAEDYTDDEDEGEDGYKPGGYHPVKAGDVFNQRYVVIKKLGWGHFSTVWMVKDREAVTNADSSESIFNQFLALKVQKSAEHYTEAAMDEVELLDCAAAERKRCEALVVDDGGSKDSDGIAISTNVDHSRHVANLDDSFFHTGPNGRHMCMVFHMLGCNFLSVIKAYNYRGIPIPAVKKMIAGIAKGLDFLHRKCQIIHTDLKPENVLLEFPADLKMEFDVDGCEDGSGNGDAEHKGSTIRELQAAIQNPNISAEERKWLKKRLERKRIHSGNEDDDNNDEIGRDDEVDGGLPPVHVNPSALALATMTLSDVEMERIAKDLPSFCSPGDSGTEEGTISAHELVLSRLSQSPFVSKNFARAESPAVTEFSELLEESIKVSCPSRAELKEHFEMCRDHVPYGGVAEVTFVVRSFVSDDEIADSIAAALGGIPWGKSEEIGVARELFCQLSIPGRPNQGAVRTLFKILQHDRKNIEEDYGEALSDVSARIGSNLGVGTVLGTGVDNGGDAPQPDRSPPFSVFTVHFSVLSTAVVLGFLESCLPGVMFFAYGKEEGLPPLDLIVFDRFAAKICRHPLAMRTEDEEFGSDATAIFGLDLRMIEEFPDPPTGRGDGAAPFDLRGTSMETVASWWNARQTIQSRVNSFLGLEPSASVADLPIMTATGRSFNEGVGKHASTTKDAPSVVKPDSEVPSSLLVMKQAISRASYQPDLRDVEVLERARSVVVDLGNACWTHRHFSEDIQTRQYRAPEVLFGSKYDTSADIWSLGCITFELLTGDLLFDPRASEEYDRDEDHLAMFQELLGKIPKKLALSGKYSKKFFDRKGNLKHIKQLKFWPIEEVLHEKYHFSREDSEDISNFMLPLLEFDPKERATALECLKSDWLKEKPSKARRHK